MQHTHTYEEREGLERPPRSCISRGSVCHRDWTAAALYFAESEPPFGEISGFGASVIPQALHTLAARVSDFTLFNPNPVREDKAKKGNISA
jgi:hypothetical protein